MHPEELELLACVEDELDAARRGEVVDHLAACERCESDVAAVESGRAALRSAPALELSAGGLSSMLASLPDRAPVRPRLAGRLLPVAAALAAAAALAGGAFVIGTSGGGDNDAASGGAETPAEVAEDAATEKAGGGSASPQGHEALKTVAGSANDVASRLRREGFDARVSGDRVIVRGARAEAVRKALEPLGPGPVRVVVRP